MGQDVTGARQPQSFAFLRPPEQHHDLHWSACRIHRGLQYGFPAWYKAESTGRGLQACGGICDNAAWVWKWEGGRSPKLLKLFPTLSHPRRPRTPRLKLIRSARSTALPARSGSYPPNEPAFERNDACAKT